MQNLSFYSWVTLINVCFQVFLFFFTVNKIVLCLYTMIHYLFIPYLLMDIQFDSTSFVLQVEPQQTWMWKLL